MPLETEFIDVRCVLTSYYSVCRRHHIVMCDHPSCYLRWWIEAQAYSKKMNDEANGRKSRDLTRVL
jgi:hypothetical protein